MMTSTAKRNRSSLSPATIWVAWATRSGKRSGAMPAKVFSRSSICSRWSSFVVTASASHVVFAGDAGHEQHEEVAGPRGVLGFDAPREQDPEQVLRHEEYGVGHRWIGEGHRGDAGIGDERGVHAREQSV